MPDAAPGAENTAVNKMLTFRGSLRCSRRRQATSKIKNKAGYQMVINALGKNQVGKEG